jgi:hypothetical protein
MHKGREHRSRLQLQWAFLYFQQDSAAIWGFKWITQRRRTHHKRTLPIADFGLRNADWEEKEALVFVNPQSEIRIPQFTVRRAGADRG